MKFNYSLVCMTALLAFAVVYADEHNHIVSRPANFCQRQQNKHFHKLFHNYKI